MKIAFVISTFPPKIGGMGQVAFEEAKRLAAHGHEITVFTLHYPGVDENEDKNWSFKVVRMKGLCFGDAGLAPQLFFKLKGFDLVHLHYPFYGSAHLVFLAKIFHGQKYLLTYHMDARPNGFLKRLLQNIYDFLWAKLLITNALGIITVDKEHLLTTDFIKVIDEKKVKEIYNGVDTEIFSPEVSVMDNDFLPELKNKKIILFVGNPLPFKRLGFLIKSLLKIKIDNFVLLINSGGYDIDLYKKLVSDLGLVQKVKFLGRQKEQKDLARLYRRADCLVVASAGSAESFSLVALEAQACGCPVVVSDTAGIRKRVENNIDGFWFETMSEESLAQKIDQILNLTSEQRLLFRQRARQKVLQNYSWDKHTAELESYYQFLSK